VFAPQEAVFCASVKALSPVEPECERDGVRKVGGVGVGELVKVWSDASQIVVDSIYQFALG
jgi:hypothetical protein